MNSKQAEALSFNRKCSRGGICFNKIRKEPPDILNVDAEH